MRAAQGVCVDQAWRVGWGSTSPFYSIPADLPAPQWPTSRFVTARPCPPTAFPTTSNRFGNQFSCPLKCMSDVDATAVIKSSGGHSCEGILQKEFVSFPGDERPTVPWPGSRKELSLMTAVLF